MLKRLIGITKKEFTELIKDKLYLTFVFVVPVIVMFLLGYGLNLDVKGLPVAFLDYDRSKLSRDYIDSFVNSEYFKLYTLVNNYKEAEGLLNSAKVRAVVIIPPDFSQKLYKKEKTEVQVLIDGTYPSRAEVVKGYISTINTLFNQKLLGNQNSLKFPIELEIRAWYNPALESKNFIMPGMLVTTLCFYPVLLSCLVVVREKEFGSIFNYYTSPAKRWEIIFGKAIPYVFVCFLTYLILFAITVFIFQTKFIGNFIVLSLASILYLFCTVGLGLFISTITKTQITAMLLAFITTVIPTYLYSGFLYPVSSMEFSGKLVSRVIPATYFLDIVRGIYLKGLPFHYFIPNILSLFLYASVVYLATILNFKKKL
ncbi:ABC transporter permease [Thermodesulfobacterium sp.]|jgi:ABC-2 type transport system permease protein|uniref:ABC transporter permease n=1 Tax=Thermodesulfobacterium commune TaxID=1741 RepID=A0A117LCJ9_9BACT|nr:ABC transporter permease [Thermodesulfobacterium sp.]KUK38486.1 MAG: ABC-2 type transporter [Thermodesulfobacterium commune]MBZ4681654.1 multidrug transporter ATPase [Thermodesulfobacterium sp.]MDN5379624.1 drug efflux transport system permease protein [Thermodesulfobacterium sp.]HAA83545.1 ABC transporter permease [Thermodesulfobacterium commune]